MSSIDPGDENKIKAAMLTEHGIEQQLAGLLAQALTLTIIQHARNRAEVRPNPWFEVDGDHAPDLSLKTILDEYLTPERVRSSIRWFNELCGRYRFACLEFISRVIKRGCPKLAPGQAEWIFERAFIVVCLYRLHVGGAHGIKGNDPLAAIHEIELGLLHTACADPIPMPNELYTEFLLDITEGPQ